MSRIDRLTERVLGLLALSSIGILALIAIFIVREGAPLIAEVGLGNFFATEWRPTEGRYGILLMIAGSLVVTFGALLVGLPLGLASAVVLSEMVSPRTRLILKPLIEIQAGIPSVVYGFMGLVVLVPWIRENLGGAGVSALAAALILGIMILPTVLSVSLDALQAVPRSYREASLALGATEWQTIGRVVLPAARSGIVAAVILGLGRAVGETMAVIMVAGNSVQLPLTPLHSLRTLTANIALEMGYASGDHRAALFATGLVLFVIIMGLNTLANLARGRARRPQKVVAPAVAAAELPSRQALRGQHEH